MQLVYVMLVTLFMMKKMDETSIIYHCYNGSNQHGELCHPTPRVLRVKGRANQSSAMCYSSRSFAVWLL